MTATERDEIVLRFEAQYIPEPNSGCWLWTGGAMKKDGRGEFHMNRRKYLAPRAAWILFRGPIVEGAWVLHRCNVPACVNPDHLYLGDVRDNSRDMIAAKRHVSQTTPWVIRRGSKHGMAKLNEGQVLLIRKQLAAGAKVRPLAREYGVNLRAIQFIRDRQTWAHLPAHGEAPDDGSR